MIRIWFNILNVKSRYYGKNINDKSKFAIEKDDEGTAMQFMKIFHEWLRRWQHNGTTGLSSQTIGAAIQTTSCYGLLVDYLLNFKGYTYVLTGHILSDFLEGRFGWLRQLSGANYYNAVVQMLQAEKRIRIRSLVKMGFNLKEIKEIFEEDNVANLRLIQKDVVSVMGVLNDFSFENLITISDQAIIFSLAGYIARNIIKDASLCEGCVSLLSPGKENMVPVFDENVEYSENDTQAKEEFLRLINRGGLLRPSDT